eukprot:8919097-Ditylum_brightwellii.AAC.1
MIPSYNMFVNIGREADAAFEGQKWDVAKLDNNPMFGVLDVSSLVIMLSFVDGSIVNWEGVILAMSFLVTVIIG